jgi:hypothetical protein
MLELKPLETQHIRSVSEEKVLPSMRAVESVQTHFDTMHGVLGIYLTNKCNIECRHCCVNSGPAQSSHLAIDQLLPQIAGAVKAGIVKAVHISGGEPFLYQNDLRRIAEVGRLERIPVAVNTNAFWAIRAEAAQRLLESLPGVTQLIISADDYHEEHLSMDCVVNGVIAGLMAGLVVHISICTPQGKRTELIDRLEERLGRAVLDRIGVFVNAVGPGGRADSLPEANCQTAKPTLPKGLCRLLNRPVVLENGSVLACCNTTVAKACAESNLNLGNVSSEPLVTILNRAKSDYLIQAIRVFGPSFLAEQLSKDHYIKLKGEYLDGDICSLCSDIMSKPELVAALEGAFQAPNLRRLISAARELTFGETA